MIVDIVIVLSVPVVLFLGGHMIKRAGKKEMPKDNSVQYFINPGYKTGGSMRSQAAWEFANTHSGNLYIRFSVITTVLGILLLLILPKHRLVPEFIMGGQLIFAVLPLWLTEKAIEQNFDRHGDWKI